MLRYVLLQDFEHFDEKKSHSFAGESSTIHYCKDAPGQLIPVSVTLMSSPDEF